jgi:hypothetical protein
MAATVEIDEQNGATGGGGPTLSHNITNSNMGSVDAHNLDPVANPLTPGDYTYEKWQKMHCTAMGGSSKLDNFKVWRTDPLGGSAIHLTNLQNPPINTTYTTPVNTTPNAACDQVMPTSVPASTNIGVGGATTGLTGTGSTDFILHQIQSDAGDVAGSTSTMNYQYDETA